MSRVRNTHVYSLNFRLPMPFGFKGYSAILWWCLLWYWFFGCEGLVHRRSGEQGWGQFDYHTYPHPGRKLIHSSEVMVEVVNRLGLNLLAIHNEHNENNIAISPYGALTILVALGEGLQGEAVKEIQIATQVPNDISTIRVGLRDIHRHLKSYFIPVEGFLAGLTLNNHNVSLKHDYKEILKFYGFDIMSFNNALYPDSPTITEEPKTVTTTEMTFRELTMETTPKIILMPTIEPTSSSERPSEPNLLTTNAKEFTLFTIAEDITTTGSPALTTTTKENVRTDSPVTTTTAEEKTTTESVVPTTTTKDTTTLESAESIPFIEESTIQSTTIDETTTTKPTITTTITTPKQTTEIKDIQLSTNDELPASTENHNAAEETSKTTASLDSATIEITTIQGITSTIESVTTKLSTIQVAESFTENDASTKQEETTEKQFDSTITTIDYVDASSETTTITMLQTTGSNDKGSKTSITEKAERKTIPTTETTMEATMETSTKINTETTTLLSFPYPEASTPPNTNIPIAIMDENEIDNVEGIIEDSENNKNYKKQSRKRRSILDYVIAQYHDNQRAHGTNYPLNHPYLPVNAHEGYNLEIQTRPSFPSNHPFSSSNHQGDDYLETQNRPSFPLNHPYSSLIHQDGHNLAIETLPNFSSNYQYLPLISQEGYNLPTDTRPNFPSNNPYLNLPESYNVPVRERSSFIVDGKYKNYNVDFTRYDAVLPYFYIPHLKAGAVSFPLDSDMYYLLLLLPDSMNGVDKLICDLRLNGNLKNIVNGLRNRRVTAIMPNFKLNGYVNLTPSLQKLGIRRVFEPNQADFSRMTSVDDIYITNIEQAITVNIKNYVDAGGINNRREYTKGYPIDIHVVHPFLYFVMDSEFDVALMAGKIVNPLNTRIT